MNNLPNELNMRPFMAGILSKSILSFIVWRTVTVFPIIDLTLRKFIMCITYIHE